MNQIFISFFFILSLSGINFFLKHRIHQEKKTVSLLEQKYQNKKNNKQKILKFRQCFHGNPQIFRFFQKIKFDISPAVLDQHIQFLKKKVGIDFVDYELEKEEFILPLKNFKKIPMTFFLKSSTDELIFQFLNCLTQQGDGFFVIKSYSLIRQKSEGDRLPTPLISASVKVDWLFKNISSKGIYTSNLDLE